MTFEEFEENLSTLNKPMIDKIAEDIRTFIARFWNEDYCRELGEIAPCVDAGTHPVNLYKNYKVPGSDRITLTIKFGINEFDSFNKFFDIPMTDEDYDVDNQYNGIKFYDFTFTINNNIPELFFVPVVDTLNDDVEYNINGYYYALDTSVEFEKRLENFKSFLDGNLDVFIEKLNNRITHSMLINLKIISAASGISITSSDPDLDYDDEDEGEPYDIDEDDIGATSGGYLS